MNITKLNYRLHLPRHLWESFLQLAKRDDGFIFYESGQLQFKPFKLNRTININPHHHEYKKGGCNCQ